MKPDKKPNFKHGDKVLYYRMDSYGISLTEATVTAVRQEDQHWIVHTLFQGAGGSEWKKRFTTGKNGRRPYPRGDDGLIGELRLMTAGDNLKALKKRASIATDRYRQHKDKVSDVQRQVEREAWEWKTKETSKRTAEIPDGYDYLARVLSRMGFRQRKLT